MPIYYKRIKSTWFLVLVLWVSIIFLGCKKDFGIKNPKNDSIAIYDELWNFMDKHYSMFSEKGVDWDKTYAQYKTQLKPNMTDQELFGLLNKMLFTLKDGHVSLMNSIDTATYLSFYQDYPKNFNFEIIKNNYLGNELKKSGPIIYEVFNNIGYIYYPSFSRDISDGELDKLFSEINNTKGLIIDVRNNYGGKAVNAAKLYSRLISQKTLAKYELIKNGPGRNDFFEPKPFHISPIGVTYNKPLILLTNRLCFSTCNDFALYISLLPNAQIFGDQTGGGGGVPYNYLLANGWKIQYSATNTLSPKFINIEEGIKPDIEINMSNADEANGRDPILEAAFNALQ